MSPKLENLKKQISDLKANKGHRAKIPLSFWREIDSQTLNFTLENICSFLGISKSHARLKLSQLQGREHTLPASSFVQIQNSPVPVMEMALKNGTLIKVYAQ